MQELPEIRLELKPETTDAKAVVGFKWADDIVGNRSKIGGRPDPSQTTEPIRCDECRRDMTFYAQIDSVGDEVCLADAGMVLVYVCFECFTTMSFIESG